MAMNDCAIVTLAIGQQHADLWRRYCQRTWQAYAQKHGFDLIVVQEPLDRSELAASRSPAWQKCLVLGQEFAARYRQIVLLDSDIVINDQTAPKITDQVPETHIGGVISGSHLPENLRIVMLGRLRNRRYEYEPGLRQWRESQAEYYKVYGLQPMEAGIIQTGVLVASPLHHRQLFERVYATPANARLPRAHEQIPLSHAILSSGLFQPIDPRFNSLFHETMVLYYPFLVISKLPIRDAMATCLVQTEFQNNFFLHFAYDTDFIRFFAPSAR
jgi:hypothetical protein